MSSPGLVTLTQLVGVTAGRGRFDSKSYSEKVNKVAALTYFFINNGIHIILKLSQRHHWGDYTNVLLSVVVQARYE